MLVNLLKLANQKGASDLHLCVNRPAFIRHNGNLQAITTSKLPKEPLTTCLLSLLTDKELTHFQQSHAIDFACTLKINNDIAIRLRAHFFQSMQGLTAVFRLIPETIKTLAAIHAPPFLTTLTQSKSGLILITGATGSGKSTTLSALIHEITQHQEKHIITIEDPIERIFTSTKSLIEQRELNTHTNAFNHALKDALRADPDIIVIGELRDKATVHLALQAAETGHLVFATLHTQSASKTIDRLLSYFPLERALEIRSQLAETLKAVIAQQLITIDEQRYALFEIMTVNSAISNLIRDNQISQIASTIQTSRQFGMQTFSQHLEFLQKSGILSDLLAEKAQNLLNPEIYS
ncbi:PilT/PilU family type 4a pilus ATPase [Ignatzschineria rhizosphaerae]|uniref:PilT/PilU family type 4a pilus ATPase n=1 Tax=Ignatzschineria rhizosphaerae TaxID=2923279 RepID=A0ABY3X523_9GAMM|nr:PilT/PilU family type 4a pilus ATPase [Ignatzschineria rhizosphaerae]UNM95088.1 PilT/PilU family type 4a pilus ATPase [Ignatzschineria rhizosphaerae]